MNLKVIFRIDAVIALINGLGLLFMTSTFLEIAHFEITSSIITFGQFVGVAFLFLALVEWPIPDIAEAVLSSLGRLFAVGHDFWFLIIGYHILRGDVSGPTAWIKFTLTIVIGILLLTASKKSDQLRLESLF